MKVLKLEPGFVYNLYLWEDEEHIPRIPWIGLTKPKNGAWICIHAVTFSFISHAFINDRLILDFFKKPFLSV